jgi:Domain of unknown function (DUF4253)
MDTANLSQAARAAIKSAVPSALLPLTLARSYVRGEAERSGFDADLFPGRVVSDVDPDRIVLKLEVLSVLVPEAGAMELVASLRPQLQRHGCQALVTATDPKEFSYLFGEGVLTGETKYDKESLIVFFQAESADALFWVRGTNGDNYDLDTAAILGRLKEWSRRCEFAIIGAGFDWVDLRFQSLPINVDQFAEEVYDFCPDTLDQGILLPLPEAHETLDESEFPTPGELNVQAMETIEDWMDNAMEKQTTQDLANYLKRERRLYLWWD